MKINKKRLKRLKIAAAITASSISLILFAAVILFWSGIIVAANFDPASFIYIFAGIIIVPSILYLLMRERRKFNIFCLAYKLPNAEKHAHKIMMHALIKYLLVIFALVLTSHGLIIIIMLPVYAIIIAGAFKFVKLWRFHGYPVIILAALTIAVIILSAALSPIVRDFIV